MRRSKNPWRIAGGLAAVLAVGAAGFPAPAHAQAEAPPPPPEADLETATESAPSTGGRVLQLPDISFIGAAVGKLSTDRRDADRNRLRLDEAELGIQSYVYPGIRADAFLVAPGHEQFQVELEEGYLTHEQLPLRFTGRLGKFFVPFGRDNQKHPHSWLYTRRPLVWRNLVSEEALTGNGFSLSWLAPTRGRLFVQLEGGAYTQTGHSHDHDEETHAHDTEIPQGHGAEFRDQFYTLRGWSGLGLGRWGELELGASWARGAAEPAVVTADPLVTTSRSQQLTGIDVSYRRYGEQANRLLLRGEYLWQRLKSDVTRDTARGYYALGSYRFSRHDDVGLLYDWTQIPESGGQHESAISALYTRQFTEQTYGRLQLTHGNRPGKRGYNEARLQIVWGLGPHTHTLE